MYMIQNKESVWEKWQQFMKYWKILRGFLTKKLSWLDGFATIETQKKFGFINFNDGSAFSGVQIVYADHLENFEEIQKLNVGTSIEVVGECFTNAKQTSTVWNSS